MSTQCNSCGFPVSSRETIGECEVCHKPTHSFCLIKEDDKAYCDHCYVAKTEEKYVPELPSTIRRTYIELYRSCPRKFRLEVLEGHASPPTKYTQVGIDLHDLFEKAVNDRTYTKAQMWQDYHPMFKKCIDDELFDDELDIKKFQDRAEQSINTFYEVLPSIPQPFVTEQTISYSVGEDIPDVEFTMDLITEAPNGELDLHDWKTGKVMVGQKIATDMQAPLYIYGVEQHYGRKVRSFTFYYLNEKKTRTFTRVSEGVYECVVGKRSYYIKLRETMTEIAQIFSKMKQGHFSIPQDTKKMFFTCKMCHLQEQGLCFGADQQSWVDLRGAQYGGIEE